MPTSHHPPRRRILLLEDDAPSRALIARVVSLRPGIELVNGRTVAAGIAAAVADPPALVLLGSGSPGTPGGEMLAVLRSDPRTHFVPIVVVSAEALHWHVEGALAAGADAYLTKPVDVEQLLAVIDRFTAH